MPSLKFLLDENIPKSVKQVLTSKGFIAEYAMKGISDDKLASLASKQKSVIISRDSDFLNSSLYFFLHNFGRSFFVSSYLLI